MPECLAASMTSVPGGAWMVLPSIVRFTKSAIQFFSQVCGAGLQSCGRRPRRPAGPGGPAQTWGSAPQTSALVRLNHIHLAEARRRTAVADRVDLLRLPLAVVGRAPLLPIAGSGDQGERLPEVGGARLVGDPRNHPLLLAVLDLPKSVAAELEIVALLIDREAAIAIDQDAVVHAGDQVVDTRPRLARLQPNVGHALERNAGPVVGIAAAARFALADQMGLVADGLVVFENALLDDGKLGGFHAIVVEARGGQAAIGGAIAPYIHQVAANAQRAHLVRGQEAGPGEVGLVAQGAIQLRGMPDALVNGEIGRASWWEG